MYVHVERLAREILRGANSVEGLEAKLLQVCIFVTIVTIPNSMHSIGIC